MGDFFTKVDLEIPLLLMLFYLFREVVIIFYFIRYNKMLQVNLFNNLSGRHCQVGSSAGAAHLLKYNTGVLR